ncbi:EAL domain-containing protein [Noviherbaspirillum sp. CPCC 100848]|uniref:EAL domain-containing protein n=1 Tax=Noviherbaspirillum album TaxID=3080276 RepID=A0ABU6JIV7_9BURK|nr:EAL domain-containing protein [Noviherbaspirillum sp. CPCC 100848]MEC4723448.1 EAL domain-containing protein [Noviherbaspirillum sp. CPCC 100848]
MAKLTEHVSATSSISIQGVRNFFLGRQPILDRNRKLVAYELLFRDADTDTANVVDNVSATASVILHASELGLHNVIGNFPGFINVDAAALMIDFIHVLPPEKVVLEILETVEASDEVVARVAELAGKGYRFALDDVAAMTGDVHRFLPYVDIIKLDLPQLSDQQLAERVRAFKAAGKKLLAEKVESEEQFERCMALGADYFQGHYFARPTVLKGKKLSPSQLAVMEVMSSFAEHADMSEIETRFARDASLRHSLVQMANILPRGQDGRRVESVKEAMSAVGREQLRRWLQILLCAEPSQVPGHTSPLLMMATTRGRLLELIAERIRPDDDSTACKAYTVGIMSLMDALFGMSMKDILDQLQVAQSVREALLARTGLYGDMLRLAECIERVKDSGPVPAQLLHKLGLSADELYRLELKAFEWSDEFAASQEWAC